MRKAEAERIQTVVENDPEMKMPDPKPEEPLLFQPEWCRVAFSSIGDAIITTDTEGRVTFLNPVAESLTGWTLKQAAGVALETVFKIVNEETRKTVESPTVRALRDGVVIGLANHTLLIAKDGTERPIDDSAAPIRNDGAKSPGWCWSSETQRTQAARAHVQDALTYADNIIATMREPFVVLDKSLRIKTANRSFYRHFHVTQEETEGRLIYDLGNGQWNIPRLRTLLEEVLRPTTTPSTTSTWNTTSRRSARRSCCSTPARFESVDSQPELILLAIEDITERKRTEVAVQTSEVRYRRLFETAKDGILILDADT